LDPRIRSALVLYAFVVVGLFLAVAPWTPIWTRAAILLIPTPFGAWAISGWARGLVSALGVVDLLVAAQVAREFWQEMNAPQGPP